MNAYEHRKDLGDEWDSGDPRSGFQKRIQTLGTQLRQVGSSGVGRLCQRSVLN